jgi:glycosyltransferase involved in cell wall biosynthesis
VRLAFVASHPIQYQAPLFRQLASQPGVDFEALFCHRHGVNASFDPGFGQTVQFDVPLTEGYRHRFLANWAPAGPPRPRSLINPEVIGLITRNHYDAVVLHGYTAPTHWMVFGLSKRQRPALLLRGESSLLGRPTGLMAELRRKALAALFRRADHFLAIGTLNRQFYEYHGVVDDRITLAPYSIDNERFAGAGASNGSRNRADLLGGLGLPVDGVLLLFCGKLIDVKRPLDALRAFAEACGDRPAGLVFVGDGRLKPAVEDEIRRLGIGQRVKLLGFKNQSELPGFYAACDALILPSEYEPWGLVVNEAMACGLAVAVSNMVGAAPDLVRDNGFVFPAGNVKALASALQAWVDDRRLLARHKEASRRLIAAWGLSQASQAIVDGASKAIAAAGIREAA